MARQKSIITVTGKLGAKIGFERNGKYFFRSAPERVRQTRNTRRASRRFGLCSRKGSVIRHACYNELDVRCDSAHINRLNKRLIESGGDHTAIAGFRFNKQTGIDRFFTIAPELSGNDVLHIPPQEIVQHEQLTALEVKVIAVRIDFQTAQVTGTDTVIEIINPQDYFSGRRIPLYAGGEGTLMVALQVRGVRSDDVSTNKLYLAADIIAVKEPTRPKRFRIHTHPQVITQPESVSNYSHTCIHPFTIQRE